MTEKTHYIRGQWQAGDGDNIESLNPATHELVWQGQAAIGNTVTDAVNAARMAFKQWQLLALDERLAYLKQFQQCIDERRDELSRLISRENGKPLWEAKGEVGALINKLDISLTAFHERSGDKTTELSGMYSRVNHRAHGVCAVLGPFNFPVHLAYGHIIPALLAGNTIVFKPSELTPACAEFTMKIWDEIGLPPGVINCIQGARETGIALLNGDIDAVFFTGSYATGKHIHQQFAGRPEIILAMEMGGNNPLLAFDVENVEACAYHIIQSAFITAGQRCTCARRLIIPEGRQGDAIIDALISMTKKIVVDSFDAEPEPFMGPVISQAAANAVIDFQTSLEKLGARSLIIAKHLRTNFISPGIIDVTGLSVPDVECFGPLLQVSRAKDIDSAIVLANQTQYGLSAGILTDNEKLFEKFYQHARAGIINWNRPLTGAASTAPFGGVGHSGNHRPSAYYAADYCAYPIASLYSPELKIDDKPTPGLSL